MISQFTHLTSGTIPYPSKDSQPIWNFEKVKWLHLYRGVLDDLFKTASHLVR